MRQRSIHSLRLVSLVVASAMLAGAGYGWLVVHEPQSLWRGALSGLFISLPLACLETIFNDLPLLAPLRRLPFLAHIAVKTLIYFAVILLGLKASSRLAQWIDPGTAADYISAGAMVFSFGLGFLFNFLIAINRLLGHNVLTHFITGHYHRPREEERIFLLLDLVGSTAIAERIGNIAFHQLLHRLFGDLTGPIIEQHGEIYRYVGDELFATWRLADGIRQGRCLTACFDALAAVAGRAARYRQDFGIEPQFRAGLHCGTVVSGEMGDVKREIVFLGDTVNTAARIMQACRDLQRPVIASEALMQHLTLPVTLQAEPLGRVALRGKQTGLALVALSPAASDTAAGAAYMTGARMPL